MHAIISGAGIAGLSAARFLTERGWDATVVERTAGPRPEGYMIDFFGPGWEAARAMGILPRLQEVGYHVPEARYVDAAGRTRARLDLADFPTAANGEFVSLLRPDLKSAIRDMLPDSVPIHFSSTVTAVEDADDGVTVRLSRRRRLDDGRTVTDRSTMTADLLIGADGINSGLRALVFDPEQDYFRYLGYHIAAWSYRDAAALRELGSGYALTDTLGEALGFYGLRDGRVALFAVHRTEDPACPPDPCVTLRTRYGRFGWLAPRALQHCGHDLYYDQVAQIVMPQWHRGRVVLLGDAAGAVSLLAGQGASLAMAGAYVLAEELDRARPVADSRPAGVDIPSALAAFEARWRPRVESHQAAGRRAAQWFVPQTPWQGLLRRTAIRAMRIPGLNRFLGSGIVGKQGSPV